MISIWPRRRIPPVNVFVLCTGRCGSVTFSKASAHLTNFTSGHETRTKRLGADRLDYPAHHIEADNRLSWFLGGLDERYGKDAFYVHLTRDREETARSYLNRMERPGTIVSAYKSGILMNAGRSDPLEVCLDYVDNVNTNISAFLKDKPHQLMVHLENIENDYSEFLYRIRAEGDLSAALREWETTHNASPRQEADLGAPPIDAHETRKSTFTKAHAKPLFMRAAQDIVLSLGRPGSSWLDVQSGRPHDISLTGLKPQKITIDVSDPTTSPDGALNKVETLQLKAPGKFDIVTCLDVLNFSRTPSDLAQSLLQIAPIAVVSVGYKWPANMGSDYLNAPIDEAVLSDWFGREPNASFKIREVLSKTTRLVNVYERETTMRWNSINQRRELYEKLS